MGLLREWAMYAQRCTTYRGRAEPTSSPTSRTLAPYCPVLQVTACESLIPSSSTCIQYVQYSTVKQVQQWCVREEYANVHMQVPPMCMYQVHA